MLGIIIGVMSVIVLVSIAQSTTSSISSAIASMGSDLLTITVTDEDVVLNKDDYLALEDYDAIGGVAPYLTVSTTARSGSTYTQRVCHRCNREIYGYRRTRSGGRQGYRGL
jgi:putative ABC transport system permease protein